MRDFLQLSVAPGGNPPPACSCRRQIFGFSCPDGPPLSRRWARPPGPVPAPKSRQSGADADACQTSRGRICDPAVGVRGPGYGREGNALAHALAHALARAGPVLIQQGRATGPARAVSCPRCGPARAGGSGGISGDRARPWWGRCRCKERPSPAARKRRRRRELPSGPVSSPGARPLCAVGQLFAKARHASHKIAFAQLHAVVAQNGVGHRAMKVEVG
jgi:hypothetical protein